MIGGLDAVLPTVKESRSQRSIRRCAASGVGRVQIPREAQQV